MRFNEEQNGENKIPLYIQQMFYNLLNTLHKQQDERGINIIKSQYRLINKQLQLIKEH